MVKRKTCIFISGKGSNLKNLIYHSRDNSFPIKVSLVICSNRSAHGIIYAKKYKIPYILINTKLENYENKILLNLRTKSKSAIKSNSGSKLFFSFFINDFLNSKVTKQT